MQTPLPCSSLSTCAIPTACLRPATFPVPVPQLPGLPIHPPPPVPSPPPAPTSVPPPRLPFPPSHPPFPPPVTFFFPPPPPIHPFQHNPPRPLHHPPSHLPPACSPHLCPSNQQTSRRLCARLHTLAGSPFRNKTTTAAGSSSVCPHPTPPHTRHLSSRRPTTARHRPLLSRLVPRRLYPWCPATPSRNTAERSACRRRSEIPFLTTLPTLSSHVASSKARPASHPSHVAVSDFSGVLHPPIASFH